MRLMWLICALFIAAVAVPSGASANECSGDVDDGQVAWDVGVECGSEPTGTNPGTAGGWYDIHTEAGPVCSVPGDHVCREPTACGKDNEGLLFPATYHPPMGPPQQTSVCVQEGESVAAVTPGMVLEAFRRVPLPTSELSLDPDVDTYVNLPTIFSTQAEAFEETVRIIGQSVRLQIEPSEFAWDHGDGSVTGTDTPGIGWSEAIPVASDRYLTYTYVSAGSVAPSVDTTWSARYSVAGGPWLEVPGTVTIEGATVELRVLEAPPELHGAT